MNGYVQLEWTDIDAFLRRSDVWFPSWAVPLLEDIDDLFLRAYHEAKEGSDADRQQAIKDGLKSAGREQGQ
jgi:hypothetical protein